MDTCVSSESRAIDAQILLEAQQGIAKARDNLALHFGGVTMGERGPGFGLMWGLARRACRRVGIDPSDHELVRDVSAETYSSILRPGRSDRQLCVGQRHAGLKPYAGVAQPIQRG